MSIYTLPTRPHPRVIVIYYYTYTLHAHFVLKKAEHNNTAQPRDLHTECDAHDVPSVVH